MRVRRKKENWEKKVDQFLRGCDGLVQHGDVLKQYLSQPIGREKKPTPFDVLDAITASFNDMKVKK